MVLRFRIGGCDYPLWKSQSKSPKGGRDPHCHTTQTTKSEGGNATQGICQAAKSSESKAGSQAVMSLGESRRSQTEAGPGENPPAKGRKMRAKRLTQATTGRV